MKSPRVPPDPYSKVSCKPGCAYLTEAYKHGPTFCWKCGWGGGDE